MSNNNNDPYYLGQKRAKPTDNNEFFNFEVQDKFNFGLESNLSIMKRNEDFAVPLSVNNNYLNTNPSLINNKRDSSIHNPQTFNFNNNNEANNTLSLNNQNSNFFGTDTNKSPIVPNRGYVSYYNYDPNIKSNNNNFNFTSPNRSVSNSKSADGVEYSSSGNIPTPSQNYIDHNTLTLPDSCAPKLQNIVSTVNLKCSLDLRDIALKTKNSEYNPKRFAAVIMRIREPKTTSLIFASGKMVCTGARSEEDSRKASRQYAKIIQKLGYQVKFAEFKIQNIVGSCDVKFPIKLESLFNTHSKFCSYEPEVFPGLIYKMADPKIVLLIFVSGKIVLTGAKERHDIFNAFQKIYPVLINFKKSITTQNLAATSQNNDFNNSVTNVEGHTRPNSTSGAT